MPASDMNSAWIGQTINFVFTDSSGQQTDVYGMCLINYDVAAMADLRNLSCQRSYVVTCTLRVIIPVKTNVLQVTPTAYSGYYSYPVLLQASSQIIGATGYPNTTSGSWTQVSTPQLVDYNPRTVNTQVETSQAQSTDNATTYISQQTKGSATSQTNSFAYNGSIGFFGDAPTGGIGFDSGHSRTREQSYASTTGTDTLRQSSTSGSSSMSIKDWGIYSWVDQNTQSPTWVLSQEYPWNAIRFRQAYTTGGNETCTYGDLITLPDAVLNELFYTPSLGNQSAVPPSELSLFGFDFTLTGQWLVPLTSSTVAGIQFTHALEYLRGSHWIDGSGTNVALDSSPATVTINSPVLDLLKLGLNPITSNQAENGAVVGFLFNRFIVPPSGNSGGAASVILSNSNNLLVMGTGFNALTTSQQVMTATLNDGESATLSIFFKIADVVEPYSLLLKHWIATPDAGCQVAMSFNGYSDSSTTILVNATEGAGGGDNINEIDLRNTQYASINYHDYLVPGLNQIDIVITPASSGTASTYAIRAVALGDS